MSKAIITESLLTDIADAIRAKTGRSGLITPAQMANEIGTISGGGSADLGTKTIIANGTYSATDDGVDGYSEVTVNVPSVSPTGTKQISITDNGTTTEDVTNYANVEINVSVSGGSGYSIDDIAGGAPTGAITINSTSIEPFAFYHKTGITSVSAPNCTNVKESAFDQCTGITSISFPALTTLTTGYNFRNCRFTSIALPSFTGATFVRSFGDCNALVTADLGAATTLNNQLFINCTALRTLVLRRTAAITTLGAWNANCLGGIYSNPTASTIYVPSALISTYEAASNWSSAKTAGVSFTAIEGSIYE